ncbi:MAG TPA: phage tail sheath C-terminal domain-containing protein [Fluviicola sp.]|nr:phage tail sheath C-terminal domain-containing protein [Fluviicola sp.]
MASYKTPGVYVEEITKFPPSVAQVETAIPAFIGYTEIAKRKTAGDLTLKPTRITSMLEYETYFGFAKPETDITVLVSGTDIEATGPGANKSPFLMYYSMQLYFANGGGPCYIVSVAQYGTGGTATIIAKADLDDGLAAIRKEDEPTLLLFPDATSLTDGEDGDFYSLYKDALTQCNELQDRFTIIDTFRDTDYDPGSGDVDPIYALRNSALGNEKDFLKYGAVYYPFLETILDYQYNEADVEVTMTNGLTKAERVQNIITTISSATLQTNLTDLVAINVAAGTPGPTLASLKTDLSANIASSVQYLNELKGKMDAILAIGREETSDAPTVAASNALDTWITTKIESVFLLLATRLDDMNSVTTKPALVTLISDVANSFYTAFGVVAANVPTSTILVDINDSIATGGKVDDLYLALDALAPGGSSVTDLAAIKTTDNLLYNKIKSEIGQLPITLPPSSAMAGIYARIDKTKGVWKAPANVSLNYVIKPTVQISHEEQADMNVDVVAGKSVNAIRAFTGKGVLVWGARTLAGNDNEWRYVPVRRFFNMVEESVKKATDQFVFESNDANTWVRLRAMIENFLVLQWRAGALTGAKPEQAFYVRVGLGQTMTADDILNGYMNVEIGMAVVRPAEFIVLKFSHKMQEA